MKLIEDLGDLVKTSVELRIEREYIETRRKLEAEARRLEKTLVRKISLYSIAASVAVLIILAITSFFVEYMKVTHTISYLITAVMLMVIAFLIRR